MAPIFWLFSVLACLYSEKQNWHQYVWSVVISVGSCNLSLEVETRFYFRFTFQRFSDLSIGIFGQLDNQNFVNCKLIMDNVYNKNPANFNGVTPLHEASSNGHFNICQHIIEITLGFLQRQLCKSQLFRQKFNCWL